MKLEKKLIFLSVIGAALVGLAAGIIFSGVFIGVDTEPGTRLITTGASLAVAFSSLLLLGVLVLMRRRAKRT